MNARLVLSATLLAGFGIYSVYCAEIAGPLGFVSLALAEPWGAQMFLDIMVAMTLFSVWLVGDAKKRGVVAWPWVIACFALGSLGALAYVVSRELGERSSVRAAA